MVFIKHKSLKSDIFFDPKFTARFSGFILFWVQVFLGTDFSGSRFFKVRVHVLEVASFKAANLLHTFLNLMKQDVATKSQ